MSDYYCEYCKMVYDTDVELVWITCRTCDGTGSYDDVHNCSQCEGHGGWYHCPSCGRNV